MGTVGGRPGTDTCWCQRRTPVEAIGDRLVTLPLSDTFITERYISGPRARPMLKRSYELSG